MLGLAAGAIALAGGERTTIVKADIELPVNNSLTIALRRGSSGSASSCDFALWDQAGDRIIKFAHLNRCGRFGGIQWLSDGRRFIYGDQFDSGRYLATSLFDGNQMINATHMMLSTGQLMLSPDHRYFIPTNCGLDLLESVGGFNTYGSDNGSALCSIAATSNIIHGCGRQGLACDLGVEDSDEYGAHYEIIVERCDMYSRCSLQNTITRYPPNTYLSQLRIRHLDDQTEYVYPLPGYEVIAWAWSPPLR
jgi:hypothetical protein